MLYLKLFNSHSEYEEAEESLGIPTVSYDYEHVHYKEKQAVATLVFTDFTNLYKQDLYDYSDVDIDSSKISGLAPYMISDDSESGFTIYVSVDGELTYRFNPQAVHELREEITDDFIEYVKGIGGSDDILNLLKENKGKYIFDSVSVSWEYGFIYNDTNYWYSRSIKEISGDTVYSYALDDNTNKLYATVLVDESTSEEFTTKLYDYIGETYIDEVTVKKISKHN